MHLPTRQFLAKQAVPVQSPYQMFVRFARPCFAWRFQVHVGLLLLAAFALCNVVSLLCVLAAVLATLGPWAAWR